MASENVKEQPRPENLLSQFVPTPATERAQGLNIGCHPTQPVICYGCGRYVIVRSLDDPSNCMIYRGHGADVLTAKFSPGVGGYIASGDANGIIRIWAYSHEEHLLKGQSGIAGAVRDLAWGPEAKRVLAGGDGSSIFARAFTFDTGSSLGEITGPQKRLTSVDMRQARPYRCAVASEDHKAYFYSGPPFSFTCSQQGHSNFVNAIRFSPDGEHFVTGSSDRNMFLWNGRTGEQVAQFPPGHEGSVYSVAWSPDGSRIASCGADKTVRLWDLESRSVMQTFAVSAAPQVHDMQQCVAYCGPYMLSVSLSGDINIFDEADASAPARVITGHQTPCDAVAVDAATATVYSGGRDGTVCSWTEGVANRFASSRGPRNLAAHDGKVVALGVVGGDLYSVGFDDTLRIASRADGTYTAEVPLTGQPKALAVSASQQTVVIPTSRAVHVVRGGAIVATLENLTYSPTAAAVGPSDDVFAVGANEGKIFFYTLAADGAVAPDGEVTLRGACCSLDFSADGAHIASGDADRDVSVWAVADKSSVCSGQWKFHTARVTAVKWLSADRIVSGAMDDSLYVWSLSQRRTRISQPFAHKDGVHSLAVLNEDTVVSAGGEGSISTWAFPVASA